MGVDEDRPNQVILRFAESLPDDLYRIEVFAVDDPARRIEALRNDSGDPFQPAMFGADRTTVNFELNLGAQVLAVVPQPITRLPDGSLSQARDRIEVYFNNDDLAVSSATNPSFYSLIFTNGTVQNTDDTVLNPTSVTYDATTDKAVLNFATDLDSLPTGPGTYRLRIGTDEALPNAPLFEVVTEDPGSSFATARDLGSLDAARVLSAAIEPVDYPLMYPGAATEPGHRQINEVEDHYIGAADEEPGISIVSYNFKSVYGWDPRQRVNQPDYRRTEAAGPRGL